MKSAISATKSRQKLEYKASKLKESEKTRQKAALKKKIKKEIEQDKADIKTPGDRGCVDANENIYNEPVPNLLDLTDVTEATAEMERKPKKKSQHRDLKDIWNSSVKIKPETTEKKTALKKPSVSSKISSLTSTPSSNTANKRISLNEDTRKLTNYVSSSDRLEQWINSLAVEASEDRSSLNSKRVARDGPGHPTDTSVVNYLSSQSACNLKGTKPCSEIQTQTLIDGEELRRRREFDTEKTERRHQQFQSLFNELLVRQMTFTTQFWRMGQEVQKMMEDLSRKQIHLEETHTNSIAPPIEPISTDSGSVLKSLLWLEQETVHCECQELRNHITPAQVANHVPCLYWNGLLNKTRTANGRVAFDDVSLNDRSCPAKKNKTLKKRLKGFQNMLEVKKYVSKKKQGHQNVQRRVLVWPYYGLVIIFFGQVIVQLCYS